jgi:acetoacetyl-CoA synthetase
MKPLWSPTTNSESALNQFLREINAQFNLELNDYHSLWKWSTEDVERFWAFWWQQADLIASKQPDATLRVGGSFEKDSWFPNAKLNFAENLLRVRDEQPAIIFRGEDGSREELSYKQLFDLSASVANELQALGIKAGDRVAALMPNRPETVVAMLATTWLGAIWSSCSPDFGTDGILERFEQIEPSILIAVDGYQFKGRTISVCQKIERIQNKLNCRSVVVNWQKCGQVNDAISWTALTKNKNPPPEFYQLRFNDPVYILFSSGTTGKPKCIVHGVGGTLLQHLKEHRIHTDISRKDVLFYFTTCGWMMWNWLVSGLASGCTLLLFDGNPFFPQANTLMKIADEEGISVFGTSAKYLSALQKESVRPIEEFSFSSLRTILSTGSPLVPESFDYVYEGIKADVQLSSISGGTDIVSCFVLGCPILPVHRGELQCRGLGMAVDVWNDNGESIRNEPGELVCTKPFPSKPIYFWNDPDGSRYHNAYFDRFENVWCHGDWAELTDNDGLIITGRSDAVLNPGGVRIGTSEIYRQVERIPKIVESIAVGQDWQGDVRIVLFVVLKEGETLTESLQSKIKLSVRNNASPRHVPAIILQVKDIPRTRSGKITELAVRDIINNRPLANTEALANPEALEEFKDRTELLR